LEFIVRGLSLLAKSYETMRDAQAHKYNPKKNKTGHITVEMSEEEYISIVNEIERLKNDIQKQQVAHQRQIKDENNRSKNQIQAIENQYKSQIKALEHRIEGLQLAVKKWRVKAGEDEPNEVKLIMAERKIIKNKGKAEWQYLEHITIPVEKNQHLAKEAWFWIEENKQDQYIERLYFHLSYGWVAVIRMRW